MEWCEHSGPRPTFREKPSFGICGGTAPQTLCFQRILNSSDASYDPWSMTNPYHEQPVYTTQVASPEIAMSHLQIPESLLYSQQMAQCGRRSNLPTASSSSIYPWTLGRSTTTETGSNEGMVEGLRQYLIDHFVEDPNAPENDQALILLSSICDIEEDSLYAPVDGDVFRFL
jgi:hypothetical protein